MTPYQKFCFFKKQNKIGPFYIDLSKNNSSLVLQKTTKINLLFIRTLLPPLFWVITYNRSYYQTLILSSFLWGAGLKKNLKYCVAGAQPLKNVVRFFLELHCLIQKTSGTALKNASVFLNFESYNVFQKKMPFRRLSSLKGIFLNYGVLRFFYLARQIIKDNPSSNLWEVGQMGLQRTPICPTPTFKRSLRFGGDIPLFIRGFFKVTFVRSSKTEQVKEQNFLLFCPFLEYFKKILYLRKNYKIYFLHYLYLNKKIQKQKKWKVTVKSFTYFKNSNLTNFLLLEEKVFGIGMLPLLILLAFYKTLKIADLNYLLFIKKTLNFFVNKIKNTYYKASHRYQINDQLQTIISCPVQQDKQCYINQEFFNNSSAFSLFSFKKKRLLSQQPCEGHKEDSPEGTIPHGGKPRPRSRSIVYFYKKSLGAQEFKKRETFFKNLKNFKKSFGKTPFRGLSLKNASHFLKFLKESPTVTPKLFLSKTFLDVFQTFRRLSILRFDRIRKNSIRKNAMRFFNSFKTRSVFEKIKIAKRFLNFFIKTSMLNNFILLKKPYTLNSNTGLGTLKLQSNFKRPILLSEKMLGLNRIDSFIYNLRFYLLILLSKKKKTNVTNKWLNSTNYYLIKKLIKKNVKIPCTILVIYSNMHIRFLNFFNMLTIKKMILKLNLVSTAKSILLKSNKQPILIYLLTIKEKKNTLLKEKSLNNKLAYALKPQHRRCWGKECGGLALIVRANHLSKNKKLKKINFLFVPYYQAGLKKNLKNSEARALERLLRIDRIQKNSIRKNAPRFFNSLFKNYINVSKNFFDKKFLEKFFTKKTFINILKQKLKIIVRFLKFKEYVRRFFYLAHQIIKDNTLEMKRSFYCPVWIVPYYKEQFPILRKIKESPTVTPLLFLKCNRRLLLNLFFEFYSLLFLIFCPINLFYKKKTQLCYWASKTHFIGGLSQRYNPLTAKLLRAYGIFNSAFPVGVRASSLTPRKGAHRIIMTKPLKIILWKWNKKTQNKNSLYNIFKKYWLKIVYFYFSIKTLFQLPTKKQKIKNNNSSLKTKKKFIYLLKKKNSKNSMNSTIVPEKQSQYHIGLRLFNPTMKLLCFACPAKQVKQSIFFFRNLVQYKKELQSRYKFFSIVTNNGNTGTAPLYNTMPKIQITINKKKRARLLKPFFLQKKVGLTPLTEKLLLLKVPPISVLAQTPYYMVVREPQVYIRPMSLSLRDKSVKSLLDWAFFKKKRRRKPKRGSSLKNFFHFLKTRSFLKERLLRSISCAQRRTQVGSSLRFFKNFFKRIVSTRQSSAVAARPFVYKLCRGEGARFLIFLNKRFRKKSLIKTFLYFLYPNFLNANFFVVRNRRYWRLKIKNDAFLFCSISLAEVETYHITELNPQQQSLIIWVDEACERLSLRDNPLPIKLVSIYNFFEGALFVRAGAKPLQEIIFFEKKNNFLFFRKRIKKLKKGFAISAKLFHFFIWDQNFNLKLDNLLETYNYDTKLTPNNLFNKKALRTNCSYDQTEKLFCKFFIKKLGTYAFFIKYEAHYSYAILKKLSFQRRLSIKNYFCYSSKAVGFINKKLKALFNENIRKKVYIETNYLKMSL